MKLIYLLFLQDGKVVKYEFFNKIFTDYGLNNNTAIKYLSIVALA